MKNVSAKKAAAFFGAVFLCLFVVVCLSSVGVRPIKITLSIDGRESLAKEYKPTAEGNFKLWLLCLGNGKRYYEKYCHGDERSLTDSLMPGFFDDMSAVAEAEEREKKESSVSWNKEKKSFDYFLGETGVSIPLNGVVENLFSGFSFDNRVALKSVRDEPESIADMQERTVLRGSYSTSYSSSGEGRKANIKLAAERLCGVSVLSGEQLSYNAAVGKRTAENGFFEAKIILDGEFVTGRGGGVCQVSTTLYDAWLMSGLGVTYSRAHSLPVGYVKPSFDAMVSSSNDLILKNDTDSEVFIVSETDGRVCRFSVYGKKCEYEVRLRSESLRRLESTEFTETEDFGIIDWQEGETRRITALPKAGLVSRAHRDFFIDGRLVRTEILRTDTYLPQKGEVIIRKKPNI